MRTRSYLMLLGLFRYIGLLRPVPYPNWQINVNQKDSPRGLRLSITWLNRYVQPNDLQCLTIFVVIIKELWSGGHIWRNIFLTRLSPGPGPAPWPQIETSVWYPLTVNLLTGISISTPIFWLLKYLFVPYSLSRCLFAAYIVSSIYGLQLWYMVYIDSLIIFGMSSQLADSPFHGWHALEPVPGR